MWIESRKARGEWRVLLDGSLVSASPAVIDSEYVQIGKREREV